MAAIAGGSQYVIKDIQGLGPPKAEILTTSYQGMDGGVYQTAKGSQRNVVIQLGLNPNYLSDDPFGTLRRALYKWFNPKILLEMDFINSNFQTVRLYGYVESNEPSIFSPEPSITVSIICPDPYFYGEGALEVNGVGNQNLVVNNPGTVETGMHFTIYGIQSLNGTPIKLERVEQSLEEGTNGTLMIYQGPMYAQGNPWVMDFNSIKGQKNAGFAIQDGYVPGNSFANLLGFVNGWVYLTPGINTLKVTLPTDNLTGDKLTQIRWTPAYGGL